MEMKSQPNPLTFVGLTEFTGFLPSFFYEFLWIFQELTSGFTGFYCCCCCFSYVIPRCFGKREPAILRRVGRVLMMRMLRMMMMVMMMMMRRSRE